MPEQIAVSEEFRGAIRLGVIELDEVKVGDSSDELKMMLTDLADDFATKYRNVPSGEIEMVRRVRAIFHRAGVDPTRYRPSSESLFRRAVKGKGLYFINCVVDLVNYFSLRMLCPMGLYDADRLLPPIELRVGRAGETYEGIGREPLNLTKFPLLVDAEGPFGSPISDSVRTCVTGASRRILWITFAPPGTDISLDEFAATMTRFVGGTTVSSRQFDG